MYKKPPILKQKWSKSGNRVGRTNQTGVDSFFIRAKKNFKT